MNILFTSSGRRGYLIDYFKEALNGIGEVHVGNSEISSAMKNNKNRVITPLINDKRYIPFLLDYCKRNSIDVIIPLFDIDLPVLASKRELFEDIGTNILISSEETIAICNDKWNTYKFLKDNNFYTPNTFIDLEEVILKLENSKVSFPLIIKPRWGMGSIGVYTAENLEELKVLYNKCKLEIMSTYLNIESSLHLDKSVLIQEKIGGIEYSMDVINDLNKNFINAIPLKKHSSRAGEADHAKVDLNSNLIRLGENLSQKVKHIANLDVDVFLYNDKPYVIELNARFGGTYPFSHIAGVNLPKAILKWYKNEAVDIDLLTAIDGIEGFKHISVSTL